MITCLNLDISSRFLLDGAGAPWNSVDAEADAENVKIPHSRIVTYKLSAEIRTQKQNRIDICLSCGLPRCFNCLKGSGCALAKLGAGKEDNP